MYPLVSVSIIFFQSVLLPCVKIPKIRPSMYKPPKPGNAKNPLLNRPSKYKPPGPCTWNCPQIQSKTSKNGKFTSNYKASPIDCETQISVLR